MSRLPLAGALKPLRRPRLWLGLWWLAVLAVVVLSLTPPPAMELPRHGDKLEHLLAYALLAAAAVQLFRPGRRLLAIGAGLVLMGVALEFAQGALTATRQADPADALANTVGVALGLLTALTPWRDALSRL
ncbi:hypothetical protein [Pseudoxanthomonas suwonensis]|uniref:Membrane protein n=1 Tax=Pseudoxanthomonas suwonensis TaxID=314722 RepID=A0A0E3Z173_9GAMM|nr:hypothetical protein [Pseudoxanthomonas suwonensis]AKC86522.1 membrane protein [Pseudoxanthomonas suwonensis]